MTTYTINTENTIIAFPSTDDAEKSVGEGARPFGSQEQLHKVTATLPELMAATDWQAHSVRGFLSAAAKKQGLSIESTRNRTGERFYRIAKYVFVV